MIKKPAAESYISIYVCDITVDVRIGINPSENKPQPLAVSIELFADPVKYLGTISTSSIINYQRLYDAVKSWEGRAHVGLIETYVRELLDLSFTFEKVVAARLSVTKKAVFPAAQGAGVEVFMTRRDYKKLK